MTLLHDIFGLYKHYKSMHQSRQFKDSLRDRIVQGIDQNEIPPGPLKDVLDARRNLIRAQTDYLRSRYDYLVNVIRLKLSAGTLTREDVEEINGWLE